MEIRHNEKIIKIIIYMNIVQCTYIIYYIIIYENELFHYLCNYESEFKVLNLLDGK